MSRWPVCLDSEAPTRSFTSELRGSDRHAPSIGNIMRNKLEAMYALEQEAKVS